MFQAHCCPLLLFWLVFSSVACGRIVASDDSQLDHFAWDPNESNAALVIGADLAGSSMHLPGVSVDRLGMRDLLSDEPLGFQTLTLNNPTLDQVREKVVYGARQLSDRGTFLIYFSGHGGRGGSMFLRGTGGSSEPDELELGKLAAMIAAGRYVRDPEHPRPVRRLIIVMDSCHSGALVQGDGDFAAMNEAIYAGYQAGQVPIPRIFTQFVGMTATRADALAQDGEGGAFTNALRQAFDELRFAQDPTIADLFSRTDQNIQDTSDLQIPQFETIPGAVAAESLY